MEIDKRRENQYDILRIVAMVLVVLIHSSTSDTDFFQQVVLSLAGVAVPIFFCISIFLSSIIIELYLKESLVMREGSVCAYKLLNEVN